MSKGYQYSKAYAARNAEKRKAHAACKAAILAGRLTRCSCEKCGHSPAEAHHDDYSKPLDVRWLCRRHHVEHHRIHRVPGSYHPRPAVERKGRCKRGHLLTIQHADRLRCKECFNLRDERRKAERRARRAAELSL